MGISVSVWVEEWERRHLLLSLPSGFIQYNQRRREGEHSHAEPEGGESRITLGRSPGSKTEPGCFRLENSKVKENRDEFSAQRVGRKGQSVSDI